MRKELPELIGLLFLYLAATALYIHIIKAGVEQYAFYFLTLIQILLTFIVLFLNYRYWKYGTMSKGKAGSD